MISRTGPAYSHASPVNDFEQRSAGKSGARPRPPSPRVRERPAISGLSWHLLAFRRDVHLSSSLINNYSVCGPPDRPCILMTAGVEAKRRGKKKREQGSGVEWEEVEWSRVEWSEG